MKAKQKLQFIFPVLISLLLLSSSCIGRELPRAKQGEMDLTSWNFHEEGHINLDGTWDFYWNQFISPEKMKDIEKMPDSYIPVPGIWTSPDENNRTYPWEGYATMRVTVDLGRDYDTLAIRVPDINAAFKLWVNGELVCESGEIGRTAEEMVPYYKPQIGIFQQTSRVLDIVLQISNFHHDKAGVWNSLQLGYYKNIVQLRENKKSLDLFVIGALLVMAIYHTGLFLLGKREQSIFYFGLFCFIILIRNLVTSERLIIEIFETISWALVYKIEVLTIYTSMPLFILFIKELFPKEVPNLFIKIQLVCAMVWIPLAILVPTQYITLLNNVHQFILVISCLFVIGIFIYTAARGKFESFFLLAGFLIFTGTIVNDILVSHLIIRTPYLVPLGLFFFVLLEFVLNIKFVRAEEYLRISRAKNLALLNAVPDSMVHLRLDGLVIDSNITTANSILQKTDIDGCYLRDVFDTDISDMIEALIENVWEHEQAEIKEYHHAVGEDDFYYELRMVKSGDNTFLLMLRNISDRKQMERLARVQHEQIIQADKLSALGTLVAGVAHEINNPNNAIMSTAGILEKTWHGVLPALDEYVDEYGDIQLGMATYSLLKDETTQGFSRLVENSKRIKLIVEDLKNFARKEETTYNDEVDINQAVDNSLRLLYNLTKKSTRHFTVNLGENLPPAKGQTQRIEQVIINMVQNACHALKNDEDSITLTTGFLEDEQMVFISIADTGVGMSEKTMKNMFDPFFTTKRQSGGTGLGLSVSSTIIEEHKGTIDVDSEVDKGTTITIKIPIE